MKKNFFPLIVISAVLIANSNGFSPSHHLGPTATWQKQQQYNELHPLHMVLSSPPLDTRNSTTSTSSSSSTSTVVEPKYPTKRGSEVDSRKIIATGAGRQYLTAIRLSHILFASQELAETSLHQLRTSEISFETLAKQISNCQSTRHKGGSLGWINIPNTDNDEIKNNHQDNDTDEYLDSIFPLEAREQIIHITTKPGDIVLVESSLGYHLVQIVDVMADVRKMATLVRPSPTFGTTKRRKSRNRHDDNDNEEMKIKTYHMETMGCQMNMADSSRMEGQLQKLGYQPYQKNEVENNDNEKKKMKPKYEKKPDLIVLNTCSIRDHAEQKVYSYIGPHAKRKRDGEDVTIVVAGCVAQQEGEALLRREPAVDLVMGPQV